MSKLNLKTDTQDSTHLKTLTDYELIRMYRDQGNEEAFDLLMQRAQPAITEGIRSWGGGNPALNLRARLIAAHAIKRYDPEKAGKTSVRTWVSSNMPKLTKYRDERVNVLHVPDSVKADVRYLSQLRDKHMEEYGVEPSMGWLKDKAGVSKNRFEKAAAAFSEVGEDVIQEGETIQVSNDDPQYQAWVDAVYSELDEPGRKIFEGVSGYLGAPKKPKQKLAEELNISPAAVTSRLNTIRQRLEEFHPQ